MNELQAIPKPSPDQPTEIYLTFAGFIDETAMRALLVYFTQAHRERIGIIHLLIQSPGGAVDTALALYNILTRGTIEVRTYNVGSVDSAAVLVFLAGKQRFASPDATFTMHKTVVQFGMTTAARVVARAVKTKRLDEASEAIIRQHVRMPNEKWNVQTTGDLNVSANEAKEFGLIHGIGFFTPPTGTQIYNISF